MTTAGSVRGGRSGTVGPPPPGAADLAPFDRRTLIVASVSFVVLMALAGRYGFHRDELYFLDCARHLSASYVDQPIFTPLLARISLSLFGVSVVGLRLWAALAAAGTIIVAGLLAREFGGQRTAQLLVGLGTATMPVLVGADHLFGPTAFDLFFWSALAFLVVRIGRTGNLRLWLPAGLVLGIGLANKHTIGFFAVALVVGTVLSGGWRLIANRWCLLGGAVAAVFTVPDLWWQATHQWATIAMTRALDQENGGVGHIATWVVAQFLVAGLALVWVWPAGLGSLWRARRPLWRALAWAYGLLFVLFALTAGGKVYYLAGAYVYLLAAGAVRVEAWLDRRPARLWWTMALIGSCTLVLLPSVLPLLPAKDTGWVYGSNPQLGETIGWPELVTTVDSVWNALPAGRRAHAIIFTADYGEAGAINELGRASGLPPTVSGHNTEWFWGPGDGGATTIVAVAPGPVDVTGYAGFLRQLCRQVRTAATLTNRAGIHNQEWDGHVYVCTDLTRPWAREWDRVRHYG